MLYSFAVQNVSHQVMLLADSRDFTAHIIHNNLPFKMFVLKHSYQPPHTFSENYVHDFQ